MIRINLLPIRQMKKRKMLLAELAAFLMVFVFVLCLLAGGWVFLNLKIGGLKDDLVRLEEKKRSYQPILKEIEELKKEKMAVEQKLDTIKKLQASSKVTVRVLDEIASRTPTTRLWLTSLNHAGAVLTLQGIALDNETIAQYMQQLDASDYFEKTELTTSSQTDIAKQKLKSFGLTINVVTPNS